MSSQQPYVKLISAEKHVFVIERRIACVSGAIRTMLASSGFQEGGKGEIEFPEISTQALEKVIEYFHYKIKWHSSRVPIPEFTVDPEMALEVLTAANYLDC
jgi:transcription elongation factor B subunit 1